LRYDTIRYDTRCYFNVRSKADISQLNLPHLLREFRVTKKVYLYSTQNQNAAFSGTLRLHWYIPIVVCHQSVDIDITQIFISA